MRPEDMGGLTPGTAVTVEVPATSANLGPGFDCLGLALDWQDIVRVEVTAEGFVAEVTGEGADSVPTDASHLVISSALDGLGRLGVQPPGLRVVSHNTIPHGRGLGSSSAAIVSGLVAARALAGCDHNLEWLLARADDIEGHPDNVAAAVYGGLVLAYAGRHGTAAARGRVMDEIAAVAFVPETPVSTKAARGLLPAAVPHREAAANSGRAALLVHAMACQPELLFEATEDWLHQSYRRPAMEDSYALLTELRGRGLAAVISGAGPTVLVLGRDDELAELAARPVNGFAARLLRPGRGARVVQMTR